MLNASSHYAVQAMRNFEFRCVAATIRPYAVTAALIAFNVSACAHSPTSRLNAATTQQAHDMTSSEPYRISTASEHPDLTPGEVARRMLRLAEALKSMDELNVEDVKERTGFPLKYAPLGKVYAFAVKLPESGWSYGVTYEQDGSYKAVELAYRHPDTNEASMSPVCEVDFAAASKALKDAGYSSKMEADEIGQSSEYLFQRAHVTVRVVPTAEFAPINGKPARSCIQQLTISSTD